MPLYTTLYTQGIELMGGAKMASLIQRGKIYYEQYYIGKKQKRFSLETTSLQIAKEKLRQHESARFRGEEIVVPTKTPVAQVVGSFVNKMMGKKKHRNAAKDIYYLREAFGPICPELQIKNIKISEKGKRRPTKKPIKRIEAAYFEWVTTESIASMIADQVRQKNIKAKTANRFREVLVRLYNWAMNEGGIKIPGNINPAVKVERYKETAPKIRFLNLEQIDGQMKALQEFPDLLVMVAVYIYAGLRREELCWLTYDDIDLKAGTNGMIRVHAKDIDGESWEPKTKKNRAVPISRILKFYFDAYQPRIMGSKWFFQSPNGMRWDPDNLSTYLREVNKKAGLAWKCLDFRHTFGSHLAMKGESLYKISELMGNSPEICRKHYAHLMPESLEDTVEFRDDITIPRHLPQQAPVKQKKSKQQALQLYPSRRKL